MTMSMDRARKVADAVLYEGYLLYPYRASAAKNKVRWQFGVLVPPGFTATGEPSASVTECLLEGAANALVRVRLRFLHVSERRAERAGDGGFVQVDELTCGDRTYLTFDDAAPREVEVVLSVPHLLDTDRVVPVRVPGGRVEVPLREPSGEVRGRVVVEHRPLDAVLRATAEAAGPHGLLRLRIRLENRTRWGTPPGAHGELGTGRHNGDHWETGPGRPESRERALRHSLVAAHLLIGVTAGGFVSLTDPPEWARPAAEACGNQNTWPVLAGEPGQRDVMLSSPIILEDHPGIAPESPGPLFDSTEIDEMLHLRTITLTEQEKREARATDPRAAEILRRAEELPPEALERLHGTVRRLGGPARAEPGAPWWDPGADADVSPETDSVTVAGVAVGRGVRVRLNPGRRRADAHDMFLAGRTARVEAVLHDVDGACHLAVTLEDDPGADLRRSHGRYLYFAPEEVEPLPAEPASSDGPRGASSDAGVSGDGGREA
ncbi:hypothetical protein [Sphaerisporangium sp. TRM90804]|uniref:hypothetical protein n=1 Tax=Sphaerisporangium sp. TRM90804 TaxID=3031113 RepID=UPI002449035B|nr:hypothetical protein [Sphaerisporangium sp. TRM90804]MDH2429032.1 hypothetical protein [Sphaerisporangium sp. TRM90804]